MTVPWLFGFVFYGPPVIFWEYWTGRRLVPDDQCYAEFFDNAPYLLSSSVIEFIIPFVLVLFINVMIYLNIRRRTRGLLVSSSAGQQPPPNPNAASKQTARIQLSRDRKTARSLAILVGVFLITWAPYEVCALVNPLCGFCVPGTLFDIGFWLLWFNSTVNPFLYALLQVRFRNAFIKILCCGRDIKSSSVHPVINSTVDS